MENRKWKQLHLLDAYVDAHILTHTHATTRTNARILNARIFNYNKTINVSIVLIYYMDDVIISVFVISCNRVLNHAKI